MFKRKHRDGFTRYTFVYRHNYGKNIRYGRLSATDEEVRQAAKTSCADMFIKNMPEGYDTMLKGDGSNLSQGQRQHFEYCASRFVKSTDTCA